MAVNRFILLYIGGRRSVWEGPDGRLFTMRIVSTWLLVTLAWGREKLPEGIVSHAQLSQENTVKYVFTTRKELGDFGIIESVTGLGYRLGAGVRIEKVKGAAEAYREAWPELFTRVEALPSAARPPGRWTEQAIADVTDRMTPIRGLKSGHGSYCLRPDSRLRSLLVRFALAVLDMTMPRGMRPAKVRKIQRIPKAATAVPTLLKAQDAAPEHVTRPPVHARSREHADPLERFRIRIPKAKGSGERSDAGGAAEGASEGRDDADENMVEGTG